MPPLEQYSDLRTSILLMAMVTLHWYVMKMRNLQGWETGREHKVTLICFWGACFWYPCVKIYQLNFHHLLVIDNSKADVVVPNIHPGYGGHEEYADGIDANTETSADCAMASFQIKWIKLNLPTSPSTSVESWSSPQTIVKSTPSTSTSTSASVPKNKRSTSQIGKQKIPTWWFQATVCWWRSCYGKWQSTCWLSLFTYIFLQALSLCRGTCIKF